MNKLESLIKLRIGYYSSMLDVLSKDENKIHRNMFILETILKAKKIALEQVLEDYHNEEV